MPRPVPLCHMSVLSESFCRVCSSAEETTESRDWCGAETEEGMLVPPPEPIHVCDWSSSISLSGGGMASATGAPGDISHCQNEFCIVNYVCPSCNSDWKFNQICQMSIRCQSLKWTAVRELVSFCRWLLIVWLSGVQYLVGKTTSGRFDTQWRVKTRGTQRQCQQVDVYLRELETR